MVKQMKPLDLDSEWESIVNDAARHNARVHFEMKLHRRKLQKRLNRALGLAIGAGAAVTLSALGLLADCVALPVAVVLICICCFLAGGIWEGRHHV